DDRADVETADLRTTARLEPERRADRRVSLRLALMTERRRLRSRGEPIDERGGIVGRAVRAVVHDGEPGRLPAALAPRGLVEFVHRVEQATQGGCDVVHARS